MFSSVTTLKKHRNETQIKLLNAIVGILSHVLDNEFIFACTVNMKQHTR